jgi:O-antigen ligase
LTLQRRATPTQRLAWGYVTAVFAFGLVLTISRGAWLALIIVVSMFPIFALRGSLARRGVILVGTWLGLAAIAAAVSMAAPGARERIALLIDQQGELSRPIMWRAAWRIFSGHPLWGSGSGSYGVLFDRYRPEAFQLEARWAHNDYLNTLSDYGLVGFLFMFGAWAVIAVACLRSSRQSSGGWLDTRTAKIGLSMGVVAFAGQLLVDFSL